MNLELYVITDEGIAKGRTHAEIARLACDGGADAIQLRDKYCSSENLCSIGREIRAITRRTGTVFIVNDRLDIALACGADGVHSGQDDLKVDLARQKAPRPFIIGVSVGNSGEAVAAERGGADYVAVSPVFATVSKIDAGPGRGLAMIKQIKSVVSIPVIAIGGINCDNVEEVIASGADGVAVISVVVGQPDITAASRDLKKRITAAKQSRTRLKAINPD